MFERELELEKRESSIVPLLLIVTLIIGVVAVALYFVAQSRRVLSNTEATPVVHAIVDNQPPASVHFQVGTITSDESENPHDPHYRLLEKAGYIKIGKEHNGTPVSLTEQGRAFLGEIAGVKTKKTKEGNDEYTVPLAQRKLIAVRNVTMESPSRAVVEYSWNWEPTKGGDLFDVAGPAVKEFSTWDRKALIDQYGANFYHAGPSKSVMLLVKTDKGWQVGTD